MVQFSDVGFELWNQTGQKKCCLLLLYPGDEYEENDSNCAEEAVFAYYNAVITTNDTLFLFLQF